MEKRNVVVIGAGNGGIAAAVALAQQGFQPLVLEKHRLPGGCATSFVRGRFEFDASIHCLFYGFQGYKDVWEDYMGIDANLEVVKTGVAYSHVGKDGKPVFIKYPHGDAAFTAEFKKQFPEDAAKIDEFMSIARSFKLAVDTLNSGGVTVDKTLSKLVAVKDKLGMLALLMKAKKICPDFLKLAKMSIPEFLDAYDMPLSVRRYVGSLWWYLGDDYNKLPIARMLGSFYFPIDVPCYFPRNACHEYLIAMEAKLRELGGEIRYNDEVSEILTRDGKVIGVKTARGEEIETSYIVSDASASTVFGKLIKEESPARTKLLSEINNIPLNGSFATVYLGLNASCEELGITNHHIYFTDDDDGAKTWEASKGFSGPYTFGALCPNVTIPDFSPEGTCVLTLTVSIRPEATEGMSQRDYAAAKEQFASDLIDRASYHMNINLRDYIEEIEVMTPVTLARYANAIGGALGYSIGAQAKADVKTMVKEAEKSYKGLSFVGQYSPNGIGYSNSVAGYKHGCHEALVIKEGK